MSKNKKFIRRSLFIFIIGYAVLFLLYYTQYQLGLNSEIYEYIMYFYNQLLSFILPIISAMVMVVASARYGTSYAMKRGWALAVPIAIYTLPSYYISYTYAYYEVFSAILWALLFTVIEIAFFHLQALIAYFIIKKLTVCFGKKKRQGKDLMSLLSEGDLFDSTVPVTLSVFLCASLQFVIRLVIEIVNTAIFLHESYGTYRTDEIVYIAFTYCFLVFELFICHTLTMKYRGRLLSYSEED